MVIAMNCKNCCKKQTFEYHKSEKTVSSNFKMNSQTAIFYLFKNHI